jgi:hypothetical protein
MSAHPAKNVTNRHCVKLMSIVNKHLEDPLLKTNVFDYLSMKHKQMLFVSNGGKFKLYTVPNGLVFSMATQPRFSFSMLPLESRLRMHHSCKTIRFKQLADQ